MMLFHAHLAGGWLQAALHREQPVQRWAPAVPCRASPARLAVLPRLWRLQRAQFPVRAKEEAAHFRFSL